MPKPARSSTMRLVWTLLSTAWPHVRLNVAKALETSAPEDVFVLLMHRDAFVQPAFERLAHRAFIQVGSDLWFSICRRRDLKTFVHNAFGRHGGQLSGELNHVTPGYVGVFSFLSDTCHLSDFAPDLVVLERLPRAVPKEKPPSPWVDVELH